jgi:hypothetical protein
MSRHVKYFDCPSWLSISVMSGKGWTSPIVFSFMRHPTVRCPLDPVPTVPLHLPLCHNNGLCYVNLLISGMHYTSKTHTRPTFRFSVCRLPRYCLRPGWGVILLVLLSLKFCFPRNYCLVVWLWWPLHTESLESYTGNIFGLAFA